MNSISSTPTLGDTPGPSTDGRAVIPPAPRPATRPPAPKVYPGDTVLVLIAPQIRRPLVVAEVHPDGSVSGLLVCAPDDHEHPLFRGWESGDGARVVGRPHQHTPFACAQLLHAGSALGEWITRPTNLPGA